MNILFLCCFQFKHMSKTSLLSKLSHSVPTFWYQGCVCNEIILAVISIFIDSSVAFTLNIHAFTRLGYASVFQCFCYFVHPLYSNHMTVSLASVRTCCLQWFTPFCLDPCPRTAPSSHDITPQATRARHLPLTQRQDHQHDHHHHAQSTAKPSGLSLCNQASKSPPSNTCG